MFSVLFFPPCRRLGSIKSEAYILTRSPSFSMTSGSLFRGEKWHTQLLTETHVGKAIPGKEREWMRECWVRLATNEKPKRKKEQEKEKNTFLHFLFPLEDLSSFCHNEGISLFAQAEHGDASFSCLYYSLQSFCRARDKRAIKLVNMVFK